MSDVKVLTFPESGGTGGGMLSMLAPLLQQRGIDPNLLLTMNRNNGNGFGDGNSFLWIIFLFFLMGWNRNGFGGFGGNGSGSDQGLANLINNDNGRELLMQAIQGNANAISQLASTLNCSIGQVQQAINSVATQITQVSNQVGMSSMQVINAIQQGNCNIASQLASCCCEIKQAIAGVNVGLERGFSTVAYETQRQTCDLQNTIKDSTAQILAGQRAAEMRDMQDKLDKLREENSTYKTSAMTSQIVAQAVTPINAVLAGLQKDVDGIKCKLPETTTIANPPGVLLPNCVAAQFGLYGGFPFANNGSFF